MFYKKIFLKKKRNKKGEEKRKAFKMMGAVFGPW
jgi:hypothetical protein